MTKNGSVFLHYPMLVYALMLNSNMKRLTLDAFMYVFDRYYN